MNDDENPRRRKRRTCEEYPGHCGQWPEDCVCYERLRTKAQALVDAMPECDLVTRCKGIATHEFYDRWSGQDREMMCEKHASAGGEELGYTPALRALREELGL